MPHQRIRMCDEEEVWQVAGHRRRRHRPGNEPSKPKIRRRAVQQRSHATPSATNTNTDTTSTSIRRGTHRGKSSTANSGYSYSARAGREPPRKQPQQPGQQQQQQQKDREELVRFELQKLKQLKALLMQTALWQHLVEGLESILPQLGLAFPPLPRMLPILEPAGVEFALPSGQISASAAPRGEAMLEGGDATEAGLSSSRTAAGVRSGGSLDEVGSWCLGAGPEGAAADRSVAAATEKEEETAVAAAAAAAAATARVGGAPPPPPETTAAVEPAVRTTTTGTGTGTGTGTEKGATAAAATVATAQASAETSRAAAAVRLQGRPMAPATPNETVVGVASVAAAANTPPSQHPLYASEPGDSSSRSACATDSCRTNRCCWKQQHHHNQQQQQQMLCELVCYGIGNFSENHNSRYQLALALCLRDLLFPAANNVAAGPAVTGTATGDSDTTSGTESGSCCSCCCASGGDRKADTFELRGSGRPETCQAESTVTPSKAAATSTAQGVASLKSPGPSGNEKTSTAAVSQQQDGAVSSPPPPVPPPPLLPPLLTPSVQGVSTSRPEILVFDPVMGDAEKSILDALGCGTLKNEEGKRCCYDMEGDMGNGDGDGCCGGVEGGVGGGGGGKSSHGVEGRMGKGGGDEDPDEGRQIIRRRRPTLFFMPHCPQRLYSNVLWANWSSSGMPRVCVCALLRPILLY